MWGRIRRLLLILAGLLVVGSVWFGYSSDAEITGLRNILHYQIVTWLGGPKIRLDEPPGTIAGTVRDAAGAPVAGAVVLVASPLGHTYVAESGPDGPGSDGR